MTAWHGPVAMLDVDSADGRRLARAGYLEPRRLPMPLMTLRPDDGAAMEIAGLVDTIDVRDDGAFDTTGPYLYAAGRVEPDARFLPYAAKVVQDRLDAGDHVPVGISINDVIWGGPGRSMPGWAGQVTAEEWRPMSVAIYADPALAVWPGVHIRKDDT